MSGLRQVDRIFNICEVMSQCATLGLCTLSRSRLFLAPRPIRGSMPAQVSKNFTETTSNLQPYFGLIVVEMEVGKKILSIVFDSSNTSYPTKSRQNAGTVLIPLTRGQYALVDLKDWPRVRNYFWCAIRIGLNWYAVTNVRTAQGFRHLGMHRLIVDAPQGFDVDHITRNGLDNRGSNLRICTRSQNKSNTHCFAHGTSAYRGVHWDGNRWIASIQCRGRKYHLGGYPNEIDAAISYDHAAQELFGEYARLNFDQYRAFQEETEARLKKLEGK